MKKNKLFKRLVIFAIVAFMSLSALSAVNAEIGTSTITAVTTEYTPGTTNVDLEFQIDAYSSDYEYVEYVTMDFPTGVTVNSAEDIGSLMWANPTGETGDGVTTTWGDPAQGWPYTYGYLYNEIVNWKVNVDIDSGFSGDMVIDWHIYGDIYGSAPHDVLGSVTLTEAAPDYCYFDDDFSAGFANWAVSGAGPGIVTTTYAGGTSPECRFYWGTANSGDYIMSNPVDTSTETDLWMSFRSMINHYSSNYPYNLFVEVTPDGSTWYDVTPWTNPLDDDYAAARYLLNVPEAIGTQTSVKFTITGDPFGLNYWYLDDVKICDFITFVDGAVLSIIQPTDYSDGLVPVQTRVANLGNTPQTANVNVQISHEAGGGILYFEDFNSAWGPQGDNPPAGWQIFDYGGNGIWENNDWYRYTSYSGCPRVYYSPYEDNQDEWLISPSVNCLGELDVHMTLGYMYSYFSSSSGTNIHAYIEGSTDGGFTWPHLVDDWDYLGDGSISNGDWDISSWAANEPDIKIRFRYVSPGTGLRYGYWYFNDFTIVAPTTTVADYDQTLSMSLAAGELKTVLMPDFIVPVGDDYTIRSTITITGDEEPSNDYLEEVRPLGNVDVGIVSIDKPAYTTIGPIDFTPEVTVTQVTNRPMLSVPVTYAVYEQPFTSVWETKFTEDFEGFMSPNVVTQDMVKGIETHVTDEHEGSRIEATINWLDEPNLGSPEQWTVIDNDWDDVTWHPSDTRVSSGAVSMYMGDPDTGLYPTYSDDWLISPPFNAGDACQVTFDLYGAVEYYWDYVAVLWSPDGISWGGYWLPDHFFWNTWTLTAYDPNFIHDDGSCYVAFLFSSDSSVCYEGPYLDNVEIKGSASLYSETVDVVLDGAVTQSVTFPEVIGVLDFDKDYLVQAAVQHPQDNNYLNDELSFAFDTFVQVYNTRTGKAYGTIQAAIDDTETIDGDTIVARDGNYIENINIYKDLTVTGENPPTSTSIIYGTVDIVADGVTFQNFKVIPGGLFTANEAGIFIAANDVTVQDCIIEGMTGEVSDTMFTIKGIHVYGHPDPLSDILIQNNTIRNIVNTNLTGGGGGPTWTFLKNYNLPGLSPAPEAWFSDIIDLSAYDGQTIQLAWQYVSVNEWGCYIDDILVDDGVGGYAFFEDFDSYPALFKFDGTATGGFWSQINNGVGSNYWRVGTYKYSSYPHSAECKYNNPNDDWLITPPIDLTGESGTDLTFWYLWDNTWDIEFNVYVMPLGGPTTYTYGGADGIMLQGNLSNIDVLGNSITDIHSAGWCYGIEYTPTAGSFSDSFTAGECTWEIWLYDSYGDGWDETPDYGGPNLLDVIVDGIVVLDDIYLATGGGPEVYSFDVDDGSTIELVFSCFGSYCSENSYDLYNDTGDFVVSVNGGSQPYYVHTATCQGGGPAPTGTIQVIGNYFTEIGGGFGYDVWDNPMIAPYPGVMFTIDESYPGADDGNATDVELHQNIFDNDCSIPILAVVNKDTDGLLSADMNYWGNILGPGSYGGPVYDAIYGDLADADDFSCSIVNYGPVHFTPFVGIDAVATASSLSVETGEVVTFDAEDSFAADFDDVYTPIYYWSFGDGLHSFEEQIGHSYSSPGTYGVYVRTQGQGLGTLWPNFMYDWAHLTITVTSPSAPLDANADGGNLGGYETVVGEDVQLYGSATGGEPKYTYSWDLDNGQTSSQRNPTAVYEFEGIYTVTLTVTDSEGSIATDMAQVNVLARDELIASAGGPYNGVPSVPVFFYSDVIGGTGPYTYAWDLGDGTVSDLASPIHTYDEAGAYTITLTVEDSLGEIDTDTTIVTVEQDEDGAIIGEIQGGLGVKTTITAGSEPVDWTINVDGKFVFMGGSASGSISAGSTETVRLPFSLGFGNVHITITANSITKECTAFMIGPFVLIK